MVSLPLMALGTEEDGRVAADALHERDGTVAFDDQSGEPLVPALMRAARLEEMAYFKEMKVYEKVSVEECMRATGRKPIGVRWVDINKGDSAQPNYRSRLVAKEFKGKEDRPEWFAATPPSECLKLMSTCLSIAGTTSPSRSLILFMYFFLAATLSCYTISLLEYRMAPMPPCLIASLPPCFILSKPH